MTDHTAVTAFEIWWLTKPNPNTPSPSQCGLSEDDAMAIWLSAWNFNKSLKDKSWEKHL